MFRVMARQCATCIYRPDSPLDLQRLEDAVRDKHMGFKGHRGWRVLMPPARGFGFGIHGNFAPFIPRGWMPLPPAPQEDK